jgi:hypothetical protein
MTPSFIPNVVTLVSALDEAGMFVVFAAHTHRANRQGSVRRRQCLCHVFHAAGLCNSQALFIELQDALSADGDDGFRPAERGTGVVSRQEALLLGAPAHWRLAAPLAREFSQCMARAGLPLDFRLRCSGSVLHPSSAASMSAPIH